MNMKRYSEASIHLEEQIHILSDELKRLIPPEITERPRGFTLKLPEKISDIPANLFLETSDAQMKYLDMKKKLADSWFQKGIG